MIRRCARRVDAFWFAPTDPATLALVRIAFGALVTLWALSLAPDLGAFFSTAGVIGDASPTAATGPGACSGSSTRTPPSRRSTSRCSPRAVGMTVGWHSRVCAAVVFVALTSLARANPYVFNSGDTLIRVLAFYLMLAPSGMEFSLDRRRARQRGRDVASTHPAWPLRLIQIQVSVMYASAVWSKLQGARWRDGTAVSYATRLPDLVRFPARRCFEHSPLFSQLATYGTLRHRGRARAADLVPAHACPRARRGRAAAPLDRRLDPRRLLHPRGLHRVSQLRRPRPGPCQGCGDRGVPAEVADAAPCARDHWLGATAALRTPGRCVEGLARTIPWLSVRAADALGTSTLQASHCRGDTHVEPGHRDSP